ncbi:hypothetical protein [Sporolactobacillus sp. KGMB 08714]|uniref:hypothetical protein n=1 Tax=Sporolactobacillus sp. KGMB 08714 TaxID=3064704 RepID=UPI002FBD7F36
MLMLTAEKDNIKSEEFAKWSENFTAALKGHGSIATNYNEFRGQGSVIKEKVLGRIQEMESHYKKFVEFDKSLKKEAFHEK